VTLPPGPSAHPAVQTVNWLFRPIDFMDKCRDRHGDAFSVTFIGFETPMVMISDPEAIRALVISDTGFFPDGKWHGLADAMRTEGQGEELVDGMTRESFGELLQGVSPAFDDEAIDEYFKAFADEPRRRGQLELYRSGEFSELEHYDGKLAALGVPTLVLWGENDPFAPVAGAHRFGREIPDARVEVLPGTGHFIFDEAPEQATAIVLEFLEGA